MWKVWRRILLLGTYIWSVGKWRIWVMPTLCGFSRTCQSRKIATYHVKMVEPHFTPCRHYIFMQMFKLYYNLWPITFVSRGTTWPQFFLQFFWYSKIEEKNQWAKHWNYNIFCLVRHCNTQCKFTKSTWFEWKIQNTYHKQPISWELNFDLKGLAHPLWRNWNLNPWNKGIMHPTHLKSHCLFNFNN